MTWLSRSLCLMVALATALAAGCSPADEESSATVSIVMVGDIMLGRGVASVVAGDPESVFAEVRHVVSSADYAMANLESPLTSASHSDPNPYALEADPAAAVLVASAGFDLVGLANNHAGDAGALSVLDTMEAAADVGLDTVGAGKDAATALTAHTVTMDGVTIAVLAFDATGGGLLATDGPGVAGWDRQVAEIAVAAARATADIVVVSLHGGVEFLPEPDPRVVDIATALAGWGADIVWGHGPHAAYPVEVTGSDGRGSVIAASLGNFLFDQGDRGSGAILEVMVGTEGVVAWRAGSVTSADARVHFDGWILPLGDSALIDREWWSLATTIAPEWREADVDDFGWGDVIAASRGDVTGPGTDEVVVSFRKPAESHPVRDGLSKIAWTDPAGRTPHLGIYASGDLTPVWVAGMVPAPIGALAACDGSLALGYTTLESPEVVATGAAIWAPRGLTAADRLEGPGRPACADVDGDGRLDPVILDRS